MALALCLRRLNGALALTDDRGVEFVGYGLQSADRTEPFTRHVSVPLAAARVQTGGGGRRARLLFEGDASVPDSPRAAGVSHRLLWLQAADGREIVADFTGPQYGIEDRLPETATPFWCAAVVRSLGGTRSIDPRFGLRLRGPPAAFCGERLPAGVFDLRAHMNVTLRIRDSVLGVLRQRAMVS
eukprot:5832280-Prymnesium_polylepis.1